MRLATECLRLCIAADGNHAPAYNNLGVLEMRRGRTAHARAFFQTAARLAGYLFEPSFNHALLAFEVRYIASYVCTLLEYFSVRGFTNKPDSGSESP